MLEVEQHLPVDLKNINFREFYRIQTGSHLKHKAQPIILPGIHLFIYVINFSTLMIQDDFF